MSGFLRLHTTCTGSEGYSVYASRMAITRLGGRKVRKVHRLLAHVFPIDRGTEAFKDAKRYADLFAAAPDLLEAAEKVLAGLYARIDQPDESVPVLDGITDLAAAIAKAKGEGE